MVVHGTLPRGFRPTPQQAAFRKKEVARLLEERCTPPQIAAAMVPRVNEGCVRRDAHEMGIRWVRRINHVVPDPPPVDWLNPPVVQDTPGDRPAAAVQRFLLEMKAARAMPAHAHDLLEARLNGDQGFEDWWLEHIPRLRDLADDLERLHRDNGYLRATALGRVPGGQSERVDERGQGARGVMHAVESVVDDVRGPRGLRSQVEDGEDGERPPEEFPEHPSSVTPRLLAANGVRA
jgi:hypothetical protein